MAIRLAHERFGSHIPKVGSIPVDEISAFHVCRDVMPATEHGRQHGVLVAPQGRQPGCEMDASDVQWNHFWELGTTQTCWERVKGVS